MASASTPARPAVDLSNLPVGRLPHFAGRERFLTDLASSLKSGSPVQVIHGLGGVGKTQLAMEFALRHREAYAIRWWVRAETENAIVDSLAKLAGRMGRLISENASAEYIRDVVKNALSARGGWLLVFDDAPSAESVRPYLPGGEGHVLITSRNGDAAGVGQSQPLGVLDRAEAIQFLSERTGRHESEADADQLAHALGDLPLALEQAGAVIAKSKQSYGEYLHRYETEWADLLQAGPPPALYPHTVAMTWGLAFAAVEAASPAAAELLNFAAYLCPDNIAHKMLRDANQHLPDGVAQLAGNPILLEKAMAALGAVSLVQSSADGVVIHRLVATVTRDRMEVDQQRLWCTAAIGFLSNAFRFDSADVRSWKKCGELLPHVIEATTHSDRLDVAPDATAELLNNAGRYLLKKVQYTDARQVLNRAMAITARRYGESHPKLSAIANNLGRVYQQSGDNAVAVRYFEMALTIDQAAYGAGHPHVAEVSNNYGICMQTQGDPEQARDTFAGALRLYESHYGPDHPKLANILNNLAYSMNSLGELDAAEPHLLRALTIAEQTVGPEHPTTASILYNLASSLNRRQQPAAARAHLERALAIDEAVLGPDHPNTCRDVEAMARMV